MKNSTEHYRNVKFEQMNKNEYLKVSIDINNIPRERVVDFLKRLTREIEKVHPHFDYQDYFFEEGASVCFAVVNVNNKGLADKENPKCKSCKNEIDEHAILSTGLCTACFTSNA